MQNPLEEKDANEYLETDINGIIKKAKSQQNKFIFNIIVLLFTLVVSSIYYLFFKLQF